MFLDRDLLYNFLFAFLLVCLLKSCSSSLRQRSGFIFPSLGMFLPISACLKMLDLLVGVLLLLPKTLSLKCFDTTLDEAQLNFPTLNVRLSSFQMIQILIPAGEQLYLTLALWSCKEDLKILVTLSTDQNEVVRCLIWNSSSEGPNFLMCLS